MKGRHTTNKPTTSPTFNAKWSGASYAPHCSLGCVCPKCSERLHAEAGEHYCPKCDDFVRPSGKYHEAK